MQVKFLNLKKQYLSIKSEIDCAVADVITKSAFVGGEAVRLFEEEFGEFLSSDTKKLQVLGVANGTDALEIAIEALEIPEDSVVLVPANTFAASAEAVVRNHLKIKFVDCAEDYTMDLGDLKSKIDENVRAILVVQIYGQSAQMDRILEIAKAHDLYVIEDCAQAHGAKFNGQCVGSFGDIATFSFYPGKNLGAYGDGGAIVSANAELLEKCKMIAHHGGLGKYEHRIVGRNSRLDGIQAAVLRVKLKYLNIWNARRNAVAKMYLNSLSGCDGIVLPKIKDNCFCVWHLFIIRVKNRSNVIERLQSKGIEYGLHYPIALPNTEAFSNQPYVLVSQTPNATKWQDEILSIPMGEHLEDDEVESVIACLKS